MDAEAREAFARLEEHVLALHEDVSYVRDWCERHDAEHRVAQPAYRRTPTPPPMQPVEEAK